MRLAHKAFVTAVLMAVALSTGGGFVKQETTLHASQGPVLQSITTGPLTWGLTAFCNKVTLALRDEGASGLTRVVGTNNRCGAAQLANASGSLHLNPDGTAGLAFLESFPNGAWVIWNCILSTGTGNGSCIDDVGRVSGFVLGGLSSARTDQLQSEESRKSR